MSESATRTETTAKAKMAKEAATESANFPFAQFAIPRVDLPATFREAATKWVDQGKVSFEKIITAAEEANGAFEKAYSSAAKGVADYGAKVAEVMHASTVAAFDLTHDMIAAKSLPEAMEISTAGARRQLDTLTAQNRELWTLAQQLVTETTKPIAGGWPKMFNGGAAT